MQESILVVSEMNKESLESIPAELKTMGGDKLHGTVYALAFFKNIVPSE